MQLKKKILISITWKPKQRQSQSTKCKTHIHDAIFGTKLQKPPKQNLKTKIFKRPTLEKQNTLLFIFVSFFFFFFFCTSYLHWALMVFLKNFHLTTSQKRSFLWQGALYGRGILDRYIKFFTFLKNWKVNLTVQKTPTTSRSPLLKKKSTKKDQTKTISLNLITK